jgi:nucleoid DNA-binding protein
MPHSDFIDHIAAQHPQKDVKESGNVIAPAKCVQHFKVGRELRARVDGK